MKNIAQLLDNIRFWIEDRVNAPIPKTMFNIIVVIIAAALLIVIIGSLFPKDTGEPKEGYKITSLAVNKESENNSIVYINRSTGKKYDMTGFVHFMYDMSAEINNINAPEFQKLPDSTKTQILYELLPLFTELQENYVGNITNKIQKQN